MKKFLAVLAVGGAVLGLALAALVTLIALRIRDERRHDRSLIETFYEPPAPLPEAAPGTLIRAEAIAAPAGVKAWRVLSHSRTFDDRDIAVSGMVAVPDKAPPAGGFPVVAVAHGTVGSAVTCAPSLEPFMSRSILPPDLFPSEKPSSFFDVMVKPFVDAGYAVTATDYQGLGTPGVNPYLVGEDAGRNVIDAIRLIQQFPEVQVSRRTLIWGHSQGGQASAFAGQIAPLYAPELQILGVVSGSPAAELGMLADEAAGVTRRSPLTGLMVMIVRAWTAAYPDLEPETVLTSRGLERMSVVDRECIANVLLSFMLRPAPQYMIPAGIQTAGWQSAIASNTPGAMRTVPPLRVFQGGSDPLILPRFTDAFVVRLCGAGDTVQYTIYPGYGHLSVIEPSMPDTLAWMAARLAGTPAPSTC
jgi:hypothetical protein